MTPKRPGTTKSSAQPQIGEADLAEGLRSLGLTDYETRVYLAALHHPLSRIPEIAGSSGVPQPKVYPTVKRLLARGLLQGHLGSVNTYSALPPRDAFGPLIGELEQRASEASRVVERLGTVHAEAEDSIGAREGRIKLFQGRQAIRRNFLELVARAESSIAIIARLPLMVRDDDQQIEEAVARGVKVRILLEAPDDYDFSSDDVFRHQKELGAESRRLPRVPLRLGLFDGRLAILPMQDTAQKSRGFMMLEVRNEGLAEGLLGIFELLWEKARPLQFG